MKKKNEPVIFLNVYFPGVGWVMLNIAGFKRIKDAKNFGKFLADKIYTS